MDNELKEIWKNHLSPKKLEQLEIELADVKHITVPVNLKVKLTNIKRPNYSFRYSALALSATCILMLVIFNFKPQENYQASLSSPRNSSEKTELDSLLNFYLEDDNFNFTLSELSILDEEEQ